MFLSIAATDLLKHGSYAHTQHCSIYTYAGILSVLAKCEKRGKLKLFRIPIIGHWVSRNAHHLRKLLSVPASQSTQQLQPSEAARQAALQRSVRPAPTDP